jgi:uncharacterized protein YyaL (SSP411 family)
MPNHLAQETSPYLLQHKDNPVEWYPWDAEALQRAKAEDKPIFLSIGYSACHWCHVMAHESFENAAIARLLNRQFINIKVDREERPDLDQIYMNAVELMTGHGGWPMSVFLTPDLQPFFGGTYWPPESRYQMPGFVDVIQAVDQAWQNRRAQALARAQQVTARVQQLAGPQTEAAPIRPELLNNALARLEHDFDTLHGGFGDKPKFPRAAALQFMLRCWQRTRREGVRQLVQLNLDSMARGGIYDHLAGGFARYSVDERWLVPHFEKMLYDNALLAGAYLDGFLATGRHAYATVARETLDYVLTYLIDSAGGFHSAEDADSEGEEGKFYLWSPAEIHEVLGQEKGSRFCYVYDVTEHGNFEGRNILNLPKSFEQCAALKRWDLRQLETELAASRRALLAARDRRPRPGKDDKVLLNWNALMIDTLARAAGVLGEPRYLAAATRAAEFLLRNLRRSDGRLLHAWRRGRAKLNAYLDDYTFLANALVTLYETSFEERWLDHALQLLEIVQTHFADPAGGFFCTADDHEQLLARTKEIYESSIPSGNSLAAAAFLRLGRLCGLEDYVETARRTLEMAARPLERVPTATAQMLLAASMLIGPMREIVVIGDPHSEDTAAALADLRARFIPEYVLACRAPKQSGVSRALDPIFVGKKLQPPPPTVFVCQDFTCQAPVSGKEAAIAAWKKLGSHSQAGGIELAR